MLAHATAQLSLTDSLTHLLTHSLTHTLTHSHTHLLARTHTFSHAHCNVHGFFAPFPPFSNATITTTTTNAPLALLQAKEAGGRWWGDFEVMQKALRRACVAANLPAADQVKYFQSGTNGGGGGGVEGGYARCIWEKVDGACCHTDRP